MLIAFQVNCIAHMDSLAIKLVGFNLNGICSLIYVFVSEFSTSPLCQLLNGLNVVICITSFVDVRVSANQWAINRYGNRCVFLGSLCLKCRLSMDPSNNIL